ncbi:MAG: GNAT family N-acetyltransferase [Candidatus Kapaibacterium sp.]|nr:MAG: GNAT family N-acetyltransferase [Candidatus Kapabacteria bacterium]
MGIVELPNLPIIQAAPLEFFVDVAREEHCRYATEICAEMESSAKVRGTGIAKRKPEYIEQKMRDGKAVIALSTDGRFAGFCYIETWSGKKFVANSGLIVAPEFRKYGLATRLKRRVFELSRELFPDAKIFGITTSHAVMKINTELGYVPVPFSEITDDDTFWNGCSSCPNYDILSRTQRKMCLCTGMLYDPNEPRNVDEEFLAQLQQHPPDNEPPRPPIDLIDNF